MARPIVTCLGQTCADDNQKPHRVTRRCLLAGCRWTQTLSLEPRCGQTVIRWNRRKSPQTPTLRSKGNDGSSRNYCRRRALRRRALQVQVLMILMMVGVRGRLSRFQAIGLVVWGLWSRALGAPMLRKGKPALRIAMKTLSTYIYIYIRRNCNASRAATRQANNIYRPKKQNTT